MACAAADQEAGQCFWIVVLAPVYGVPGRSDRDNGSYFTGSHRKRLRAMRAMSLEWLEDRAAEEGIRHCKCVLFGWLEESVDGHR